MQYELECGHCGYGFVLDVAVLPRTTKCGVCGGVLTLAVPVPTLPPPPPPAPTPPEPAKPAPPPPVPFPRSRRRGDREPQLVEPWPGIRAGLNGARTATDFATLLFAFAGIAAFVVAPVALPVGHELTEEIPSCLILALLFPGVVHVGGQWMCGRVPRTYGRRLVVVCLALQVCSLIALGGHSPRPGREWFLAGGAGCAVVSFGVWLAFLARLGERLGDRALVSAAQAYRTWLPTGVVLLVLCSLAALLAARVPKPPAVWIGRAGAGVLGFVLLRQYAALLRAAVLAVDRRAPVAPDD